MQVKTVASLNCKQIRLHSVIANVFVCMYGITHYRTNCQWRL